MANTATNNALIPRPPTHAVLTPRPYPKTSLIYFFGPRYCAPQ